MATKSKTPAPSKGRGRKPAAQKTKGKKPAPRKAKVVAASDGIIAASVSENKPTMGRPVDYNDKYANIARKMCSMGATDSDLAEAFGVETVTIWRWRSKYPDFCNALKIDKGEFDDRVERSLAQRAVGYSYDAVKIFMPAGSDAPIYAPYREHVPPDPGACKLWLTNRRRAEWSDTSKHEITGKDGEALMADQPSSRDIARAVLDLLRAANVSEAAA